MALVPREVKVEQYVDGWVEITFANRCDGTGTRFDMTPDEAESLYQQLRELRGD